MESGQNWLSDIPRGVLDFERVQTRPRDPLVHDWGQGGMWEVGQVGRNPGRVPGCVQSISLSPNRLDPSSKLTYQLEHLPSGSQCTSE